VVVYVSLLRATPLVTLLLLLFFALPNVGVPIGPISAGIVALTMNTSAFNCRDTTGRPGVFSNHSWGRAIDINPLTNPYLKGDKVLPPAGKAFLDRTRASPGAILAGSFIVNLFQKRGWTWGGSWKDRQDYQHFEKPDRR